MTTFDTSDRWVARLTLAILVICGLLSLVAW